jgi:hypothetical protein
LTFHTIGVQLRLYSAYWAWPAFWQEHASVLDAIIGGWQTNGNWIFESGRPIVPLESDAAVPIPTYGQRPNLVGSLRRSSGSPQRATEGCQVGCVNYFANPDALQQADDYTMGNAPRTITTVREPGTRLVNLSVFKEFSMTSVRQGMRLEFRAEAFNAFNYPNFSGPHTRAGTGSFGTIDGLDYPPREMQLALKLYFCLERAGDQLRPKIFPPYALNLTRP